MLILLVAPAITTYIYGHWIGEPQVVLQSTPTYMNPLSLLFSVSVPSLFYKATEPESFEQSSTDLRDS